MRRCIGIFAAAFVWSAPALAHGPFDGFWTLDPDWCANDPAATDRSPVMIDLPVIEGHDRQCIMETFEPVADGGTAWHSHLACAGTGESWTEDVLFAFGQIPDGEIGHLVQIDTDSGEVRVFTRCP